MESREWRCWPGRRALHRRQRIEAAQDLAAIDRRGEAEAPYGVVFESPEELGCGVDGTRDVAALVARERLGDRLDHIVAGPAFEEAELVPYIAG